MRRPASLTLPQTRKASGSTTSTTSASTATAMTACSARAPPATTGAGPLGSLAVSDVAQSGAKFSLLPPDDWRAIGLTPRRRLTFVLADGTEIERDVSECYVRLAQGEGHTPVILGESGDEPLLGVVTLEILGLVLHPFNRTLQPARLLMA